MSSARFGASHATVAGRAKDAPAHVVAQAWLAHAFEQVLAWHERARQRRHLGEFSEHMLKDIGLSRADAEAEISKPFWRA